MASQPPREPGFDRGLVGSRLGDYAVVERLGVGGMGEVFRARDLALDRDVAIKVLPAEVEADATRLARFEREARLLASVSHPHIGAIHGIVEDDGRRALVLELIEGETLAAALTRGPLPTVGALTAAAQVADALAHAHARGVLHRDVKPSNIMLTAHGAKVLDFGIGGWSADRREGHPTDVATLTSEGTIVGTLHYMSPEQLEGRPVDARTDIFALGAVLYEALTGERAFDGSSTASVIAAVIEGPRPTLTGRLHPPSPRIERLLAKCVARQADERWQSAKDLADELRWIAHDLTTGDGSVATRGAQEPSRLRRTRVLLWVAAAAVAGVGWIALTRPARAPDGAASEVPIRFVVYPPSGGTMADTDNGGPAAFDISPDGRRIAFMGRGATGRGVYVRDVDRLESVRVAGTEGTGAVSFSPDGEALLVVRAAKVERVRISDATSSLIADSVPFTFQARAWANGQLFLGARNQPIRRLPTSGGTPIAVTEIQAGREIDHHSPTLLPGGAGLLFTAHAPRNRFSIALHDLATNTRRTIVESGFDAQFSPTGHLVFARGRSLMAAPFDPRRGIVTGDAVTMERDLGTYQPSGIGGFRLSASGTLVYQPRKATDGRQLVWVDRSGRETPVSIGARSFDMPRVSPDGRRLAFTIEENDRRNVFTFELATGVLTKLTADGDHWSPLWAPDGSALVYGRDQGDTAAVVHHPFPSGTPRVIGQSVNDLWPTSYTHDGSAVLLTEVPPTDDYLVSQVPVDGKSPVTPLMDGPQMPNFARVSPDRRWLAFDAWEAGRLGQASQIFLRRQPGPGPIRQVTVDGGAPPVWSRDGREIFFLRSGRMSAIRFNGADQGEWGNPVTLFSGNYVGFPYSFDVAPDGRFLLVKPAPTESAPTQLNVVLGWTRELVSRAPSGGQSAR